MKHISGVLSFFFVYTCLAGQNLVTNGGFEVHQTCPKYQSQIALAIGWSRPSGGTPDYFDVCCGKSLIGVPYNFMGYQNPRTGSGYAGFYLYESTTPDEYREYISTRLKSTLERGKLYQVKFFVSLADFSEMATSNIEVLFTDKEIKLGGMERINKKPQLKYSGDIITDTANWIEITWNYKARGNEQYMTIGNFTKAAKCSLKTLVFGLASGIPLRAYYYVDDVCVEEIKENEPCKCLEDTIQPLKPEAEKDSVKTTRKPGKMNIEPEQDIILNNISFETNKAELLPASFTELNQLVTYLKKHPKATIEFSGYTDNTGREGKNLKLSDNRAKAVAEYMEGKGIAEKRITYKGYGSANPISDNETTEGKAKNRRVEFRIHQS